MTKITIHKLVLLLALSTMLSACSDNGDVSDNKDTVDVSEAAISSSVQEHSDETLSTQSELITSNDDVNIQDLMKQVAQVESEANEYGFVWSTTDSLIKSAYEQAKQGHESEARALFNEAIMQFELSIEQAKYAEQHWKLLVPESD